MHMHDWAEKLAQDAYDKYANQQRIAADARDSDFDQAVKRLTQNEKPKAPPIEPPEVSDDKDSNAHPRQK
jgi:hypothetical protein